MSQLRCDGARKQTETGKPVSPSTPAWALARHRLATDSQGGEITSTAPTTHFRLS
jgi:hypothetical protein